jgi:alkaline phosphatase
MKITYAIIFLFCSISNSFGQNYTLQKCHAHNDYLHKSPFYEAYNLGFGSIEVDVFLEENELYVAHEKSKIDKTKTLKSLYIDPILTEIEKNGGKLKQPLQLLIDLKTGGETLKIVENQLIANKNIFKKAKVSFVISGEMPTTVDFEKYDEMFQFDGRINSIYTKKQMNRVALFSNNFQEILLWNGKKQLDDDQMDKLEAFIKAIHKKGKKLRFWATPDTPISWTTLMNLEVDLIGTDDLAGMARFLK